MATHASCARFSYTGQRFQRLTSFAEMAVSRPSAIPLRILFLELAYVFQHVAGFTDPFFGDLPISSGPPLYCVHI